MIDWAKINNDWGGPDNYVSVLTAYLSQSLPHLALQEAFQKSGMENNYAEMSEQLMKLNKVGAEVLLGVEKKVYVVESP